jgi:replicative DNA helicase
MSRVCLDATIDKIMKFKYVVEEIIPIEKWGDLIDQIQKLHNKPPVIMIDYLRKLRTENSTSDERLRVDNILSNLTGLAKKHNIPVLAISELARDSYKSGQRLSMASFKESGTIEYEASWLGILAAVEEINGEYKLKNNWERIIEQDGNIDLIVFKAKRGTGSTGKIPLKVDRDKMTVSDRIDENKFDSVIKLKKNSIYD